MDKRGKEVFLKTHSINKKIENGRKKKNIVKSKPSKMLVNQKQGIILGQVERTFQGIAIILTANLLIATMEP